MADNTDPAPTSDADPIDLDAIDWTGTSELATKHVFVDTSEFHRSGFAWRTNRALQEFQKICEMGLVQPLVTEVLREEIKAGMAAKVRDARDGLAKKLNILWQAFPDEIDEARSIASDERTVEVVEKLGKLVDTFFGSTNAREVPLPEDCLRRVLNAYYARAAPFGEAK